MVFSSIIFLFCFLPVILFLYYVPCLKNIRAKNVCLLLGSLLFYTYGEGKNVVLLLTSVIMNHVFGLLLQKPRKAVLTLAVIGNLGLLFVYKYLDFTIGNINLLFGSHIEPRGIALPIGISFFTFQALSYVIDVYRKKVPVQKNPFYTALYISLFPQLVAGPIVRYETIMDQITGRKETADDAAEGIRRFIAGMGKKVLLADTMSVIAERIMATVQRGDPASAALVWLGALCYTLRIYYDFSGYSDMAIGLGRMFGFRFEENFNYPYISKSITEFWRRWHISLSGWFRDYVYIPLGGSRVGRFKQYRNIMIVWLLTGLWHGAAWNFVLWGVFYAILLMAEKISGYGKKWKLPAFPAHLCVIFFTLIGWTIFSAPDMEILGTYLGLMFGAGASGGADATAWFYLRDNLMLLLPAVVFSVPVGKKLSEKKVVYDVLLALVLMLSILYIIKGNYSPFIYFNF